MKKALMLASVASMIDKFNMENIGILKQMGYSVDVATNFEFGSITSQERVNQFKKELEESNINTYHVPIPRSIADISNMLKAYKFVFKLCEDNDYEIVHCHSPIGGVIARLACRGFRKNGTKIIYTAHGFHFFDGASKVNWLLFYPIEKFCARYTDCLITINKEDYERAKTFPAKRVEYVPGIGVNVKKIQSATVNKKEMRRELGLQDDDFVIFSVGQTSKRKNHEVIIKALAKIKNPKIKYMICGFGELDEYLRTLVEKLGIKDRVVFTGFRNDVYMLLHIVDMFAFPSLQEGLPVALMEAMAAGLPVVCSRIRGNIDLIEDGKGGFMYSPDDTMGFSEGIEKLFHNEKLRSSMGGINFNTIQGFDVGVVNKQMEDIYARIEKS